MMSTSNWQKTRNEEVVKVAILGEGSVGKTTISKSFSEELNTEGDDITMTKGVDITVKRVIHNGAPVTIQIWDFAGQKQFRFMIDIFLRGIKAIMYVYDVTDVETLIYLSEFVELARNYLKTNNYPDVPEILVGNKVDLGETEVTIEDIHEFMKTYNIPKHYLVSGIYGENVSQPFEYLVSKIVTAEDTQDTQDLLKSYTQS